MSHTFENYFSPIETSFLADSLAEDILRACIHYGPRAIADPNDYEARANLMWCAPWAINGFLDMGKPVAWSVHKIEHELSAFYDITHGVGLAILTPNWMRYVLNERTVGRFARYGTNVMGPGWPPCPPTSGPRKPLPRPGVLHLPGACPPRSARWASAKSTWS